MGNIFLGMLAAAYINYAMYDRCFLIATISSNYIDQLLIRTQSLAIKSVRSIDDFPTPQTIGKHTPGGATKKRDDNNKSSIIKVKQQYVSIGMRWEALQDVILIDGDVSV